MIVQQVGRGAIGVELTAADAFLLEELLDALDNSRTWSGDRLHRQVAVKFVGIGPINELQVKEGLEQVFHVGVPDLGDFNHLDAAVSEVSLSVLRLDARTSLG